MSEPRKRPHSLLIMAQRLEDLSKHLDFAADCANEVIVLLWDALSDILETGELNDRNREIATAAIERAQAIFPAREWLEWEKELCS